MAPGKQPGPGQRERPDRTGPLWHGGAVSIEGVRRRPIRLVLPTTSDPRLRVSAVIITLQILGQTVLGFRVSIAQIAVSIGLCAFVETGVMLWRQHVLAWPSSGILTGNSIAFILRASGTRHGDWWSLHGVQYFVLAALLSLVLKYLVRPGGRHVFNPSNVGLVGCLLVMGPGRVFPQYLWWGRIGPGVGGALAVIMLGAFWVLRPLRMLAMAASFLATFAALIGVLAVSGHRFYATWHSGPIGGGSYWLNICTSPELLIFVFFMISDPQTAPRSPPGRIIYGAGVASGAAALIATQSTEYGIKLGILAGLTVVCALIPLIETASGHSEGRSARLVAAVGRPAIITTLIIAVAATGGTVSLADNKQVRDIERGVTTTPGSQ
jgi:Na+-translocating ferredoxin:NAD+ oxidoreductase RnfD subunit